jgi:hypothetical protein
MLDKLMVVAGESKESPDVLAVLRDWPVSHFSYLLGIRGYTGRIDHVAQIANLLLTERAFAQFHLPLVVAEQLKNCGEMFHVFRQ